MNDFGVEVGYGTMLWTNVGDGWRNDAEAAGIAALEFPMGALYADLDGDGREDLWFSNLGPTRAFQAVGPSRWVGRPRGPTACRPTPTPPAGA